MLFNDIPGQYAVKKKLIHSVKDNRISHAQLFHGPEGCGKMALAIAYAQYITCTNKQENDSCGLCPSCIKYNKLAHPDLHFTFPTFAGKNDPSVDDLIEKWRETVIDNP